MTRRVTQNQDGFYQQCYYGRGKLFHGVLVWLDSASSFTGSKEGDNRWLASPRGVRPALLSLVPRSRDDE